MQEYNGEQKPKLQNGISILCHLYSFKTLKTILCIDYGYMHILKCVKPCMIRLLNTKFRIIITIGKAAKRRRKVGLGCGAQWPSTLCKVLYYFKIRGKNGKCLILSNVCLLSSK